MSQVDKTVVSPGLRKLLIVLFFLFAVLIVDSVYLSSITFLEWIEEITAVGDSGPIEDPSPTYQGTVYQFAFLAHLILGFVVIMKFF